MELDSDSSNSEDEIDKYAAAYSNVNSKPQDMELLREAWARDKELKDSSNIVETGQFCNTEVGKGYQHHTVKRQPAAVHAKVDIKDMSGQKQRKEDKKSKGMEGGVNEVEISDDKGAGGEDRKRSKDEKKKKKHKKHKREGRDKKDEKKARKRKEEKKKRKKKEKSKEHNRDHHRLSDSSKKRKRHESSSSSDDEDSTSSSDTDDEERTRTSGKGRKTGYGKIHRHKTSEGNGGDDPLIEQEEVTGSNTMKKHWAERLDRVRPAMLQLKSLLESGGGNGGGNGL